MVRSAAVTKEMRSFWKRYYAGTIEKYFDCPGCGHPLDRHACGGDHWCWVGAQEGARCPCKLLPEGVEEEKVEKKDEGNYVKGADGTTYEYRRITSVLERRPIYSGIWSPVRAGHFETMTPTELRLVARLIEDEAAGE